MEFPNPANAPILRIPPELRLQIYDLATATHWDTYPRIYSGFVDGLPEPPFLRVCRTFRVEGPKPYFGFLKDKEAGLLKSTMRMQGREFDLRELAKGFDGGGEEIGWLVMNRLWIERDLLPDVQKELKRLRQFGLGAEGADCSDAIRPSVETA
ncbi:hypothetical protein M409DRAFT_30881 [Zasmidium cellare ATCC 36951]|uniref:Uncharacterized protein n=1 Tax=Zasmidium cellare ATCC 36951 TaxID=1080233 RepID=A0A6A6BV33_ZASCE|nr:uncharacterized protein M409DRAFT_30881 [Zasmidium cellare ATCC 36951]KAF2158601.1 hypothetical protein M409DRAFT_30881 [Zasmidium cellare ATCC 36951]